MNDITPDKLELLRTALPKGISAGDSAISGISPVDGRMPDSQPPLSQQNSKNHEKQPAKRSDFNITNTTIKFYNNQIPTDSSIPTPAPQQAQRIIFPLQLEVVLVDNAYFIRVYASTIVGGTEADAGFSVGDIPPFLLPAATGYVQATVRINGDGEIIARSIDIVGDISEDTYTDFHCIIGTVVSVDGAPVVNNLRYGPIDGKVCRNWFSNPPTYSMIFASPSLIQI